MSQTLKLYIPKVLSENKIVLLKGIGTLRINYRSAQEDSDLAVISAPREEIYFVPGDEERLDPILIKVVELIARVDHEEATDLVHSFMVELRSELRGNGFLTFPDVGWIKQDNWGSLFFEPAAEYIAINRFFGLGQVELPEALSAAEQEVMADLKETVSEKTARAKFLQRKQPERAWGFIIGAVLLLMVVLAAFFFQSQPGGETIASNDSETPIPVAKEELLEKKVNEAPVALEDLTAAVDSLEMMEKGSGLLSTLEVEETVKAESAVIEDCVIIVGAFARSGNVRRMLERLEESAHEPVVFEKAGLTRVGLKVNCTLDQGLTLEWAREEIDSAAWMYKRE